MDHLVELLGFACCFPLRAGVFEGTWVLNSSKSTGRFPKAGMARVVTQSILN